MVTLSAPNAQKRNNALVSPLRRLATYVLAVFLLVTFPVTMFVLYLVVCVMRVLRLLRLLWRASA